MSGERKPPCALASSCPRARALVHPKAPLKANALARLTHPASPRDRYPASPWGWRPLRARCRPVLRPFCGRKAAAQRPRGGRNAARAPRGAISPPPPCSSPHSDRLTWYGMITSTLGREYIVGTTSSPLLLRRACCPVAILSLDTRHSIPQSEMDPCTKSAIPPPRLRAHADRVGTVFPPAETYIQKKTRRP